MRTFRSVVRACNQNNAKRTEPQLWLIVERLKLSKRFIKQEDSQADGTAPGNSKVICSWCGAVIRANAEADAEQMCLICHARMLNDYFQKIRKFDGGGRFESRRRP